MSGKETYQGQFLAREKQESACRVGIPAWLFTLVAILFDELMLQIWTAEAFVPARAVCIALFTASFAAGLAFFTALGGSERIGRIVALVLTGLCAVAYLFEFFIDEAFMSFMSPLDLAGRAGDIAGNSDFVHTTITMILKNVWRIVLLLAPVVAYGIFGKKLSRDYASKRLWILRAALCAACVALLLLGLVCVNRISPDIDSYYTRFTFDSGVRSFGLPTALRLQLMGREDEGDFTPATLPTVPTTEPTDEAPGGDTSAPSESETAAPTEPPFEPQERKADIDFAALAESETDSDIAKLHKYVASLTPTMTNEYTGLFEGKNLIFITAEAFSKELIDPELTPTLYRLMTQGIYFADYYQPAWGGSTSTGEYSNLTGLIPTSGVNSIQKTANNNMYYTIGNALRRLGYSSFAYHNNTYTYYGRNKTHCNLGYDTFVGMGNGMEEGVERVWPESDLQMIDFTVEQYIDKQPFSVYYMTVSGHGVYTRLGNTMSYRNYDKVKDLPYSEPIKCYLAANLELEYAMQSLVQQLEEAGIADNTVIVLATDHYPYCLEKSDAWGTDADYLSELYGYEVENLMDQNHSQLIIWSGCIEGMGLTVETPTYSLDILPTLSNLFGVDYDSRLFVGRDVFSDEAALVIFENYSWKTELGYYNAARGEFTAAEGAVIPDGYVKEVNAVVNNKIYFSRIALNKDYYGVLFGKQ